MGAYLYGFTDRSYQPSPDLRGLADAPIRVAAFDDVAAVISTHPVMRLMPSRRNVEPHHRVVRDISGSAPRFVPAAFGHISESEAEILAVLRANGAHIRAELGRLARKCEMNVKLSWNVPNIFDHLVRTHRALREARDRVFATRQPSLNDKLQLGSLFEATLNRERERLSQQLLDALADIAGEVAAAPPRVELTVCQAALLVDRARVDEFSRALASAAARFDQNFAFEYTGPWPPYSFVRLRLQLAERPTAA